MIELFEKLPKGGDTLLGKTEEGGQDISGGEWQRVAIARLLMKQVNFMILDDQQPLWIRLLRANCMNNFHQ